MDNANFCGTSYMDEVLEEAYAFLFRSVGIALLVIGILLIVIALRIRKKKQNRVQTAPHFVNDVSDNPINGFHVEQEIFFSDGNSID